MIDFATMEAAIYDWIFAQTGLKAIWANQNGIIPDKPFFSVNMNSYLQRGGAIESPIDGQTVAGEYDITTTFDFTLEILGFGPGIIAQTLKLKNSLNNPLVNEFLLAGGVVSYNDTNPVLNVSGIDNDLNEERSSYDAMMRTIDSISDVPYGRIEIVNAEGTYTQPGRPDIISTLNIDSTI